MELPVGHISVEVYFHDDPEGEPYEDPEAVAATTEPDGYLEGLWNGAGRAATWTGGVLAGDYDEDPDTSQIITRMALTMIPGVDQVADVQDLSAVLYRLVWKQEWDRAGNWILLLITLIGLIPVLGSLAKGVLKLVWKKADDLLGLFRVFNYFRKGNAHRWLRDLASDLTGKHLDAVKDLLSVLLTRIVDKLASARRVGRWFGQASRLDDAVVKIGQFRGVADAKLAEAAAELKTRLLGALARGATPPTRAMTKQDVPHTVRQGAEAPLVSASNASPRTRLPRNNGKWVGEPGNGTWYPDNPQAKGVLGKDEFGNDVGVVFKDGRPDFSPWSKGEVEFNAGVLDGSDADFAKVHEKIMEAEGLKSRAAADRHLKNLGLTAHHHSATTIQLIPSDLHNNIPHIGSASDMRVMQSGN